MSMPIMSVSQAGSFRDLKQLLSESDDLDNDDNIPFQVRERTHRLCSCFLGGTWKKITIGQLRLSRIR